MPASVSGSERLRLFCALPLPEPALERLVTWQGEALRGAGAARLVPPGNLHVTLVFLGWRPVAEVEGIAEAMRDAAEGVEPPSLTPERYRETRSVGMIVLADHEQRATLLTTRLAERLERLGVFEPERRPWLPHVTVSRLRRPPRLGPAVPDLAPFSPSGVALYQSVLRRRGVPSEPCEPVARRG